MRKLVQKIISPFLKKTSTLYLSRPRKYKYKDLCVWVEPSVFPPFITISTKLLLEFLETLSLEKKTFLELGCGCGIISILAAKKGAKTTASDINMIALEALRKNAKDNETQIEILYSDLFDGLQHKSFDCIVINPPYYPKNPDSVAEKAWFCGEHFEYFEKLFAQLPDFTTQKNEVYMILSEDCKTDVIFAIAEKNGLAAKCILEKTVFKEINYIYKISKTRNFTNPTL
ncbi:methyltransferase [Flavobacterium humi]|uniref:Methyltransferase domain-containing protein n=1 Tax=Flavobacterium humi TaxID=2562683 RepID=A0A4Z0L827_9FLAO|nr:methyltransferase [Flavobacterium humi]TGD57290.1 methyltransferase domain-containing protein [Flavobacterium humi]